MNGLSNLFGNIKEMVRGIVKSELSSLDSAAQITRIGTITDTVGPKVRFDGETAASGKAYTTLYPPVVGDRVLMVRAGNSWVIAGRIGNTDWQNLPIVTANGWAAWGNTSYYNQPMVRKSADGIVEIRGLITRSDAVSFNTAAVLPVGLRPAKNILRSTPTSAGIVTLEILSNGSVNVGTGYASAWHSIDAIFLAGQ